MDKFKIIGSLVLVNLFFGTGIPLLKSVLHYIPVPEWLYFRAVVATFILFLLVSRLSRLRQPGRQMFMGTLKKTGWWFIAYLIIVPTIITYSLNLWSLKRVEASHAALYVYIQPLAATLFAFLMFGDTPSPRFYISSGLVFLGLLLGSLKIIAK